MEFLARGLVVICGVVGFGFCLFVLWVSSRGSFLFLSMIPMDVERGRNEGSRLF